MEVGCFYDSCGISPILDGDVLYIAQKKRRFLIGWTNGGFSRILHERAEGVQFLVDGVSLRVSRGAAHPLSVKMAGGSSVAKLVWRGIW